jgi:rare lipoprotein A
MSLRACVSRGCILLLLLAGCSHAPRRPGPPPTQVSPTAPTAPTTVLPGRPPDVSQIPDAVPKFEPRSEHGNPPFYVVAGRRYAVLQSSTGYVERGVASWYGTEFHGLRTSTGESYDMFAMTAAHKTLPLPCYARITNLSNGRSAVVRINDRGPFVANRIVDLSYSAAAKLDMIRNGTAFVQLEVLTPAAPTVTASLPVSTPAVAATTLGVSSVPPATTLSAPAAGASSPAPADAVPSPVSAPTTFYIQVGAYSKAQNADNVARRLRVNGIEHVMTLAPTATQALQRVRIGPIQSVQQFDKLIAQLQTLGFPNARLAQD